jgi:histidinol-phosphate aminotransferase
MNPLDWDGPISRVDPGLVYRRPRPARPVDLKLDGNEGAGPSLDPLLEALRAGGTEVLRRYPDVSALESVLAERHGIDASQVMVTAGADEAIDRCCRAFLAPGRTMLVPDPSFEMLDRYAALAGGQLVRVPWTPDEFPTAGMLAALTAQVAIVTVVSPNNPTGQVATGEDVRRLATHAPHALLLLDHAYVEYADQDLTADALAWPNVVVTRTFSKAWGLAGCRVGYALGSARVIAALRAAGGPYAVAASSVAFVMTQLVCAAPAMDAHVARIRHEREEICARLETHGLTPRRSQANFVYADLGRRASFVHAALAAQGILVRDFPDRPGIETALRITLPGDAAAFARLTAALDIALAPDALLLDLDGVLADVTESYLACILATARDCGVLLSRDEVHKATMAGDANNDWILTHRLLAARGVRRSIDEITHRFQNHYLGANGTPGLREAERLIVARPALEKLAGRLPIAIVTGRPRAEAEWFLERVGIRDLVRTVVAMEDAPAKPDPAPVRLAMQRLGATRAWMVGDTPDDARAAVAAGALALAVPPPGSRPDAELVACLCEAGAAVVLDRLSDLVEVLP